MCECICSVRILWSGRCVNCDCVKCEFGEMQK